ncbi:MAG: formylmethanofuran--tetrahydromethanopterin N-formyltransferase [Candidatus Bathyarchaeota archaeon]|nr:formylmethanofuran--tetrahydromethanopterin N-formyltransferase [Candidatus Bathyarchaeota archaeon]MDH5622849.1 formylmethanofuran--tetrahydromethanopterin N-formyltransferase [Candidatus Bathyarchaeota archaeon]MDH5635240.1 formylmethanofuran--tetrahydromethanopterin N-formyltransferase [Candidatus Bathyarchaeota archaeon]MDH5701369.1 formylmethanofuran--tetrahydromethanopterin N-formyltransferase [Candidatus Bathyarchaeota archaeon]
MKVEIEDTYSEAFDGLYCRVIVTADDEEVLKRATEDATATPSIVIGRTEGGIERWLSEKETPDGRKGAILQFWGGIGKGKPLEDSVKKLEVELSYRIRQDILVKPFTALFDALLNPDGKIDMMERVGRCGDGFEWGERLYGRNMIVVPIMVSNFLVERQLGYAKGVMGTNFWYMCKTKAAVMEAGRKALKAIHQIEGVITPFDICSAGSKPETNFPWIGPTTNHPYCPTLKEKLGRESKVPEVVNYIPEIVINGTSIETVKEAMKVGIQSVRNVNGVVKISAGNYEGKLGRHKIYLRELFP